MQHRHIVTLCTINLTAIALAGSAAFAGELTIADLASQSTVFVAGVNDFSSLKASFDQTSLRKVWDDPEVQEWFEGVTAEFLPELKSNFEKLGIDLDEAKWPTGSVGVAIWPDFEDLENAHVLGMADFGEAAGAMHDLIVAALERASEQETIELRETEIDGTAVWTIEGLANAAGADFEDMEIGIPFGALPGGEDFASASYYARSGDYLLFGNSLDVLEESLVKIDGGGGDALSDAQSFQITMNRVDSQGLYFAVFAEPFKRWFDANLEAEGDDLDPTVEMGFSIIRSLGLLSMNGVAGSISFDTDDAMVESAFALLTNEKTGIFGLIDAPQTRFTPPAFIGADIASVTMMQFNFDRIIPLLNDVIASLPAEEQAQMQQMGMFIGMAQPLLSNIGPQIVASASYERPFSATSQQMWAIRLRDEQAVTQSLVGIFPMLGFQPRDFQGNQIWSPVPGAMLDSEAFSLGMGFGYMFLGPTDSVENAMRQAGAGADGAPRITDEPRFGKAIKQLGDQAILFSYTDTKKSLEWGEWYLKNLDQIIAQQMAAFAQDDPNMDEQMIDAARDSIPAWLRTLPPLEVLTNHFGDSVSEFRPTAAGFEGRMLWLRAND